MRSAAVVTATCGSTTTGLACVSRPGTSGWPRAAREPGPRRELGAGRAATRVRLLQARQEYRAMNLAAGTGATAMDAAVDAPAARRKSVGALVAACLALGATAGAGNAQDQERP